MEEKILKLLEKAETVYLDNFSRECWFERAVFLSWYCSIGDCTFCYMSTQKDKIKDPKKARRRLSSVLAEVLLTKELVWGVEFLSAGYGSFSNDELLNILEKCFLFVGEKLWLNVGYLTERELEKFIPFVKGVSASIESVNWKVRKEVCPSKPVEPMLKMLELAEKKGLKKAITLIVGLGGTIEDIEELFKFVEKYKIDRVTFYSLNPHPGTPFTKSPELSYYLRWIASTRIRFPKLEIVAGSWIDRPEEFKWLLKAGANAFTKLPAFKSFGTFEAKKIEEGIKEVGRVLKGSITELPAVNWEKEIKKAGLEEELEKEVLEKLKKYLQKMEKNINQ